MLQSRIEIYDTPKLQYRVCFHAVRNGYIVTANGVPAPKRDLLAVSMTENIERMIRLLSGRPELTEWLDRQRSLYAVSAYAPNGIEGSGGQAEQVS